MTAWGYPPPRGDELLHDVLRGESLYSIAAQPLAPTGDWAGLQGLNQVRHPRRLPPGTQLRLPLAWRRQAPIQAEVAFCQGQRGLRRPGAESHACGQSGGAGH